MTKYRKKPVIIDAIQFNGESDYWIAKHLKVDMKLFTELSSGHLMVETMEGKLFAKRTDWIIKDIDGEVYPCDNEIFLKTYEPV